jgi:hypothetical protein
LWWNGRAKLWKRNIFIMLTTTGVDSFRENETFDRNFYGTPMFCTGKIYTHRNSPDCGEMVLGKIVERWF